MGVVRVVGVGERVVGKGRTWKHGDRHADKSSGQGSGLSAVRNENLTPLFLGSVQRLEREYQSGKRTGREGLLNQQSTKSRVISVCFFFSLSVGPFAPSSTFDSSVSPVTQSSHFHVITEHSQDECVSCRSPVPPDSNERTTTKRINNAGHEILTELSKFLKTRTFYFLVFEKDVDSNINFTSSTAKPS